ncbi:unnamed protein product [Linum trigynum]
MIASPLEPLFEFLRIGMKKLKQDSITVPDSNLDQGFKELLESEVGWDIVFHVGDEAFRAHKSILAARSPVSRAQFFGPAGDPNLNEVTVDDILPSVFKVSAATRHLPSKHDGEVLKFPETSSNSSPEFSASSTG